MKLQTAMVVICTVYLWFRDELKHLFWKASLFALLCHKTSAGEVSSSWVVLCSGAKTSSAMAYHFHHWLQAVGEKKSFSLVVKLKGESGFF